MNLTGWTPPIPLPSAEASRVVYAHDSLDGFRGSVAHRLQALGRGLRGREGRVADAVQHLRDLGGLGDIHGLELAFRGHHVEHARIAYGEASEDVPAGADVLVIGPAVRAGLVAQMFVPIQLVVFVLAAVQDTVAAGLDRVELAEAAVDQRGSGPGVGPILEAGVLVPEKLSVFSQQIEDAVVCHRDPRGLPSIVSRSSKSALGCDSCIGLREK